MARDPRLDLSADYDLDDIPDGDALQARYAEASAAVPVLAPGALSVPYATRDPRQVLDVLPPPGARNVPAVLFFHGGYWQFGSKDSRRFPAPAWQHEGVAWVAANYRLTPHCALAETVADARSAAAWLYRHGEEYGIDRERIVVAGNSAGGHLTAMILADGWREPYGLPPGALLRGCPVSGLYELSPLLQTPYNEVLKLDAGAARRLSPVDNPPPPAGARAVVAYGAAETAAFVAQSEHYAAFLAEAGVDRRVLPLASHHHFSVIGEFARAESPLFTAVRGLMDA